MVISGGANIGFRVMDPGATRHCRAGDFASRFLLMADQFGKLGAGEQSGLAMISDESVPPA